MIFRLIFLVTLLEVSFFSYYSEGSPEVKLSRVKSSLINNSSCHCINYNCGCCSHLDVPKIKLNNTVCINITYLPDEYGISFTFSIDGKVYFNDTISLRNPPPICFGVPYLEKLAAICIDFYDLDIERHKVHGCVKLEARLEHFVVGQYNLGCFNISIPLVSQSQIIGKDLQNCVCSTTMQCNCCKLYSFNTVDNEPICVVSQYITSKQQMNISVTLNNQIIGHTLIGSGLVNKCFGYLSAQEKTICLQYNFTSQNNKYSVCFDFSIYYEKQNHNLFNHTCFDFLDKWHGIYTIFKKLLDKDNKDDLEINNKTVKNIPFSSLDKHLQDSEYLQDSNFDFKCQCKNKNCSCCGTFVIEILHIQGSLCVSVQYLYKINSIFTRVVYSNILVMETTVPAAPSPAVMLFKIPSLPSMMDLGLSFSDVFITQSCQLCMNLWLAVNYYVVGGIKIGCINAPRMFTNGSLVEEIE